MNSRFDLTHPRAERRLLFVGLIILTLAAMLAQQTSAQCVDHPDKKTAVRFSNESSFELTFFVDTDEKGVVVASRALSNELEVAPGEHLFRARVVLSGESFYIWIINEIPEGEVCTWTVTDPAAMCVVHPGLIYERKIMRRVPRPHECQN